MIKLQSSFGRDTLGILLVILGLCSLSTESLADKKPNIVLIMADDLGYAELGCYGQKKIKTPYLDRLAASGMRFTDHYCGTSVCAPTRCSLMTGLHTGHGFVRANSPGYPGSSQMPIPSATQTVSSLLKKAGYKTACIGKWGLGNHKNSGNPNAHGFDLFFGYYDQKRAHNYYTDFLYRNGKKVPLDGKTYSHDLLIQEALEFIEQNRQGPFFLYLPVCIPHTKFQVPELGEYEAKGNWRPQHRTHAAMITRMDRGVGLVVEKIKSLGIEKDTLILFTSDHGAHGQAGTAKFFNSCGPFRGIKRSMYEGGLRVPLIANWPGKVKPGTESGHLSAFWDYLPTFAELAGAKIDFPVDGISMVPTLHGGETEKQKQHEHLYWELFEGKKHNRAVRQGKWKAVMPNAMRSDKLELYDLDADPAESIDLSKKHPQVAMRMRKLLNDSRVESKFWNRKAKGFDLAAACKATGVEMPNRRRNKNKKR